MCNVRTFVTPEYEIWFVHTYVTYENVIWPNVCYTQKYDILVCLHLSFLKMKMCDVLFSFTFFFTEFGQMFIKMFQKLRGSDSFVFKIWTSA